jgi:hypothetical protein
MKEGRGSIAAIPKVKHGHQFCILNIDKYRECEENEMVHGKDWLASHRLLIRNN